MSLFPEGGEGARQGGKDNIFFSNAATAMSSNQGAPIKQPAVSKCRVSQNVVSVCWKGAGKGASGGTVKQKIKYVKKRTNYQKKGEKEVRLFSRETKVLRKKEI